MASQFLTLSGAKCYNNSIAESTVLRGFYNGALRCKAVIRVIRVIRYLVIRIKSYRPPLKEIAASLTYKGDNLASQYCVLKKILIYKKIPYKFFSVGPFEVFL